MKFTVIAVLAAFVLSGCSVVALKGAAAGIEAIDASKDFADEVTDRREDLRQLRYSIEDRRVQIHLSEADILLRAGDIEGALEQLERAADAVEGVYPDLQKIRDRINNLRK